jgi:hypothetical protein
MPSPLSLATKLRIAQPVANFFTKHMVTKDTMIACAEEVLNVLGYLGIGGYMRFGLGIIEIITGVGSVLIFDYSKTGKKKSYKYLKHGATNLGRALLESVPLISFTLPGVRLAIIAYDAIGLRHSYTKEQPKITEKLSLHYWLVKLLEQNKSSKK